MLNLGYWVIPENILLYHRQHLGIPREKGGSWIGIRVCTGFGKPGKSWNFVVAFSRTGKCWKRLLVLESSGNLLTQVKNIKCITGSNENLKH